MEILYKIGLLILFTIAGAYLYRKGGDGSGTLWRDAGVPTVGVLAMLVLKKPVFNVGSVVAYTLWWGLCFASLTTYNKWASKLFGYKDNEVHWPSWVVTGLAYGVAALPLAFLHSAWLGFTLRTVLLALGVTLVSEFSVKDWVEEYGRGALIILSLPLLLI